MRHILTPLALLTLGGLTACGSAEMPVMAEDADLYSGLSQSEWCEENGYTPGTKECSSAWFAYNAQKNASGGTTERESDDPAKTLRYGGAPGGTKQVSNHGSMNPDDIDPDSLLHEWGLGMYGHQLDPYTLALVDQFDPNMFHTVVSFDQPTEVYGISQHEAFDIDMQPLQHSELLVHTNRGIFEMNDAMTPIVGMQFFVYTQW